MNYRFIIIAAFCVFIVTPAWGVVTKDLGVAGRTYPIVEPDILTELQQQAAEINPGNNKEKIVARIKKYQPAGLHILPRATEDKSKMVDMTYTLERNLTDGDGKVIYPRGYTFNPLHYVTFSGGLVVINGADPAQVKWFEKSPYFDNHQARLLLSSGHAFEMMEKLQRSVFYLTDDIADRLQVTTVPSLVIQQGDKIKVQEFKIIHEK